MHDFTIETTFLAIIGIVLISNLLFRNLKIPMIYSTLILSYIAYHMNPKIIGIEFGENFDAYLLFTIPIILMKDAYHFKWTHINEHKSSIAYLSIVAVTLSIIAGSTLYFFNIFPGLTLGMYVVLFSINMATDAISVENIMSQFKNIPHNIRILVEGESLGNDATAMVAFYFVGLPWIISGTFDLTTIPFIAFKIFLFSSIVGLIIGTLGFYILKIFKESRYETLVLIAVSFSSFVIAEKLHLAGILSLIIAMISLRAFVDNENMNIKKNLKVDSSNKKSVFKVLKTLSINNENQKQIEVTLSEYAYMAVIIVFFALSDIIKIDNLIKWQKEIYIMFAVTTIIRMISMSKFVYLGTKIKSFDYIGIFGWFVLSMAGIKGALSIIMVHSLPKNFEFLERFEAITVGVILLSIFIYGTSLLIFFTIKDIQAKKNKLDKSNDA